MCCRVLANILFVFVCAHVIGTTCECVRACMPGCLHKRVHAHMCVHVCMVLSYYENSREGIYHEEAMQLMLLVHGLVGDV